MMTVTDNVEEALEEIGFGRWQWLVLVTVFVSQTVGPVQQLSSPLLSAPVPYRCSFLEDNQPRNSSRSYDAVNEDGDSYFSSLCLNENSIKNTTLFQQANSSAINISQKITGLSSCPVIEYDTSIFQSTVVTEWNLVCESLTLRPLFQMAYPIGSITGSAVCGQLSDWLGRKRALQIGCLLTMISNIIISVVPWYGVMIFLRILTGIGTIFMLFPGYTILSEVSPTNSRTMTNMIPGLTYFMGMSALAGVAYLRPFWRQLILLCNTPLLIVLPLTFIIDESPRWLLQAGRAKEAVCLFKKAAEKNGATFSSSTLTLLSKFENRREDEALRKTEEAAPKGDTKEFINSDFISLLRTYLASPGMRIILIVTPIMWFCQKYIYVGIAINANNFTSSNPFEYVAFSGAMGCAGVVLSLPLAVKLPRRVFLLGSMFSSGALMLLEMAVPSEYWWLRWIMVLAAFCLSCGAYQINYIYALELHPTTIRTRGFTFSNFVGSIGELTVSAVTEIVVQYKWWAPSVTFGIAGIVGGLLLFFLPETLGKAMPDTLQDVEERYHKKTEMEEPPRALADGVKDDFRKDGLNL